MTQANKRPSTARTDLFMRHTPVQEIELSRSDCSRPLRNPLGTIWTGFNLRIFLLVKGCLDHGECSCFIGFSLLFRSSENLFPHCDCRHTTKYFRAAKGNVSKRICSL